MLDWVLKSLAKLFCPCLKFSGKTKADRLHFPLGDDCLLSVWLVSPTPAHCAYFPDKTQTLSPSEIDNSIPASHKFQPLLEERACLAVITIQQSSEGKKEADNNTANMKKDSPGTIPALLCLHIQAFFSVISADSPQRSLAIHCAGRSHLLLAGLGTDYTKCHLGETEERKVECKTSDKQFPPPCPTYIYPSNLQSTYTHYFCLRKVISVPKHALRLKCVIFSRDLTLAWWTWSH